MSNKVNFLRRLIADQAASRSKSGIAMVVLETEGIGVLRGSRILYTAQDYERAANMLTSRGHDVQAPVGVYTRGQAPRGASEKAGALRVTENLVAVSTLNMPEVPVPTGTFMATSLEDALLLAYDAILVVENLEPMLQLSKYKWLQVFTKDRRILALYRGAPTWFRTEVAAKLIRDDTRPTLAFFDFDPAGLAMAAILPRRQALCLPPWASLQARVLEQNRLNLFAQSVGQSRTQLDRCKDPDIALAWSRMKKLTLGLDQEHFPSEDN
ncbi:DUF7281 domain-containing protein [Polaromonas sp. P5_D5]